MKYLFSTDNTNLIITLDTESGKYNPEITTINDPNITLENDRIWFYENGKYVRNFSFDHVGTISGVTPTSIADAFTKLNAVIDCLYLLVSPNFKGSIVPTDLATGTEDAVWIATQAGTYPNHGNVVVNANSRAEISRVGGVFSISQTPLDVTGKVNVSDVINTLTSTETTKPLSAAQGKLLNEKNIKIEPWTAKLYASGDQVNYLGKDWVSNAATLSTDIPGTSVKWVNRLSELALKDNLYNRTLNLLNINKSISGYWVSPISSDGIPTANANFHLSDFIEVTENSWYLLSSETLKVTYYITKYDINKNIIPFATITEGDLIDAYKIPVGIRFIRLSYKGNLFTQAKLNGLFYEKVGGYTSAPSLFQPYGYDTSILKSSVAPLISKSKIDNDFKLEIDEKIKKEQLFFKTVNLFDINSIDTFLGFFIRESGGGNLEASATWGISNFIPVSTGDVLIMSANTTGKKNFWIAPFDLNKNFITGGIDTTYLYYTVPSGVKYVRISVSASFLTNGLADFPLIQLEKTTPGGQPKYYEKFGYRNIVNPFLVKYPNSLTGKNLALFGDSITEFGYYAETMQDKTGAIVSNCGVGGCRMSFHEDVDYNKFSMTQLADSIASGVWTAQDTAAANLITRLSDDNTKALLAMKSINFSTANYLTIFFGTNDFGGNIPMGTNTDNNKTTFKGSINYTISKILTAFPNIKLFFITPMWRIYTTGNSDTLANSLGLYLKDYTTAIKDICLLNHIPVIDLYNESGINSFNYNYWLIDGLHPNANGGDMIAKIISGKINIG